MISLAGRRRRKKKNSTSPNHLQHSNFLKKKNKAPAQQAQEPRPANGGITGTQLRGPRRVSSSAPAQGRGKELQEARPARGDLRLGVSLAAGDASLVSASLVFASTAPFLLPAAPAR